jgi:hypothetical protein
MDKNEEILRLRTETVMKQLQIWFSTNYLILNNKKTRVMLFSTHQCQHPCRCSITYKDMEVRYSSKVKFAGLIITENLNWKIHIQSLCTSLSKVYYIIKYLREVIHLHVLKTI